MGDKRLKERTVEIQMILEAIAARLKNTNPDYDTIVKELKKALIIAETAESLENTHSRTI